MVGFSPISGAHAGSGGGASLWLRGAFWDGPWAVGCRGVFVGSFVGSDYWTGPKKLVASEKCALSFAMRQVLARFWKYFFYPRTGPKDEARLFGASQTYLALQQSGIFGSSERKIGAIEGLRRSYASDLFS